MITSEFSRGKEAEVRFAAEHLTDVIWPTKEQDMFEHWDVMGKRFNDRMHKYDVKALRKINRSDPDFRDDVTWVEETNVRGDRGWLKGEADYIVFERQHEWLVILRQVLYEWVVSQLTGKTGKELYSIYTRPNRLDKITLIKYDDIPRIYVRRLPKHY